MELMELLVASLLLIAMPGAPSSVLVGPCPGHRVTIERKQVELYTIDAHAVASSVGNDRGLTSMGARFLVC